MLGATLFTQMRSSYERVIDTLGVQVTWTQAKTPHNSKSVVAGMKIAGVQDDAIVQAYGVGARIMTLKASDFPTPPEKFDRLAVDSEVYTAEAVQPVHLNAALVGYKIYIKGK